MTCRALEQFLALYQSYAAHRSTEGKAVPDPESILGIIKTLTNDYFVLDKTAGNQPESEERLSLQIQKLYPDLSYELVQFGTRYGKNYFNKHRTNRLKSQQLKSETNCQPQVASAPKGRPTATVKIAKRRAPDPKPIIKKVSRRSTISPLTPLPPSPRIPKRVTNRLPVSARKPEPVIKIKQEPERDVLERDDYDLGIDEVRCFLHSAMPDMIHLLDCLVKVGFRNADYLQEASKLSKADLDELFRNMDGVSRLDAIFLQRHLLSVFGKLKGGPSSHAACGKPDLI